jgi:hypothetical protein
MPFKLYLISLYNEWATSAIFTEGNGSRKLKLSSCKIYFAVANFLNYFLASPLNTIISHY